MNKIVHQAKVFYYFLLRDAYVFSKNWKRVLLNFGIFVPITMTIAFGYFLPNSNMIDPTAKDTTTFFVGCILWSMFPLAFLLNMDLLFDLEHDRFIDYQMITLDPRLILLEKIVFSSLVTFFYVAIFYPIARLLLGNYFYAEKMMWLPLFFILYLGSLFCASFNVFVVCFIENTQKIANFWNRVNNPMITLGGLFIPWSVMTRYSLVLGILSLFNPLVYLTEGIRQAIIGGHQFFSITTSSVVLISTSIFFYVLCCYYFKKKVDYVS